MSEANDTEFSCNLSEDFSTHEYERDDAIDYAQSHALSENYNLYYPSYDDQTYGDCTNFVSQSIYESGDASMFLITPVPTRTDQGQSGWYLLNGMQRASAWNHVGGSPDVNAFYDFVLENGISQYISEGPEGCEMTYTNEIEMAEVLSQIQIGDVIQYEWHGDVNWDHSVIVVSKDGGTVQVASHSPNFETQDYDYTSYKNIRFIHIERSDGEPPVKSDVEFPTHDENSMDCDGYFPGNEVYLGACEVNGQMVDITSGFYFEDIEIPQGAEIKYAYITFSVDGLYTNPDEVPFFQLQLFGDKTVDSLPFIAGHLPQDRNNLTGAVNWDVAEDWNLTNNHNGGASYYSFTTPEISSIIEEIVSNPEWVSGNPISIIIKNNGSETHRRVIAVERAVLNDNLFPARLIVAYSADNIPTATPTTTASITPTYTQTLTPTFTPTFTTTPTITVTPSPTSIIADWPPAEKVLMSDESEEKSEAFSDLLCQVRDEVMVKSSNGDEYIKMVYNHAPEIMTILSKDEKLRLQVKELALDVEPLLYAMVNDSSAEKDLYLEKDWIENAIDVMTMMQEQASPELQKELDWWIAEFPEFAGKTGLEIWKSLP